MYYYIVKGGGLFYQNKNVNIKRGGGKIVSLKDISTYLVEDVPRIGFSSIHFVFYLGKIIEGMNM